MMCLALVGTLQAAELRLGPDSNVKIVARGEFGNSGDMLPKLLEKYLLRALGKTSLAGAGDMVTFLIESRAEDWRRVPQGELKSVADLDAFEIEIATAPESRVRISGATALAAGYGITHFLEEYPGVVWAFPGELGLCVPARRTFALPAGKERHAPEFVSRLATGLVYPDPELKGKSSREGLIYENRIYFLAYDYFKSLRFHPLASPSHNMINVITPEMQAEHPEVFPIQGGQRWFPPPRTASKKDGGSGAWQAWHPCYSHPKTLALAVKAATASFERGDYCFSLGINDGRRVQCDCPDCRRTGFPRAYYNFVSRVAEAVKRFYPPRLVGVLAYGDVKTPPGDLKLPDNVVVLITGGGPKNFAEWTAHARHLGAYEYCYGAGYFYPNLRLAAMQGNARFYREHGFHFFRCEMPPLWAFDAPLVHLRTRLLWEPDLDLAAQLRKFCDAAFAEGGEAMTQFYLRWAKLRERDIVPGGVSPMALGDWPFNAWRAPVVQFHRCSGEDFAYASDCLARARAVVRTEPARQRLAMVETFFADSHGLYRMNQLAARVFDANAEAEPAASIAEAQTLLARRKALLTGMKNHPEWFLGTSSRVEDDLAPSWEDRASIRLEHMTGNALIGAVLQLAEKRDPTAASAVPQALRPFLEESQIRPLTLRVKPHPWYDEPRFMLMRHSETNRAVRLQVADAAQRIGDDSWLSDRLRSHYAALVCSFPTSRRSVLRLDLDARGGPGRLHTFVMSGGGNKREIELLEVVDAKHPLRRRLVIPSPSFNRSTWQLEPADTKQPHHVFNLHLVWEPLDDDATFEATCDATEMEFRAAQPRAGLR